MTRTLARGFIATAAVLACAGGAGADRLDGRPDLRAVSVARGYAFAVAAGGEIWSLEIRRGLWRKEHYAEATTLLAVHVSRPDDVWAAGAAGALVHFDGDRWTSPPGERGADIHAVAFATRARGIAVGSDGAVYNFVNGWQSFDAMRRKPSLRAVARVGSGGRERFVAVGDGGHGMSFTGVGASLASDDEITGVTTDLVAIAGCPGRKAEAVAVGAEAVLRDKSGAWRMLPAPPRALTGVVAACRRGRLTHAYATTGAQLAVYDASARAWTTRDIDGASSLAALAWLDKRRLLVVGAAGFAAIIAAAD